MPFFTNDQRLANEYNDPGTQSTQPLARPNVGQSTLSSTATLSNPFGLDNLQSLANGQEDTTSPFNNAVLGAAYNPTGMMSTANTGVSTPPQGYYPTPYNTRGINSGDNYNGDDYSPYGSNPNATQDWLNASAWEKGIAGMLNPYGGAFGLNLAHGINPTPFGTPTLPWYSEGTDFFGNPLSDAQLGGSGSFGNNYGGNFNQYEKDVVDMFGWGSPEHLDAINDNFNEDTVGGGFTSGFTGDGDTGDQGAGVDVGGGFSVGVASYT
jgi:hypothetical protein